MTSSLSPAAASPISNAISGPVAALEALPAAVAEQAVHWFVELGVDRPSAATLSGWQSWLRADPLHERAWQHLKSMDAQWQTLPPGLAKSTLAAAAPKGRRRALQMLCLLAGGGTAALVAKEALDNGAWHADFRTAVGEQRTLELDYGTQVVLNTCSAINVEFSATHRRLRLLEGEILVSSAAGTPPLLVQTVHGQVQAFGPRFSVRREDDSTLASALQGHLQIRPQDRPELLTTLAQAQRLRFSASSVAPPEALDPDSDAWSEGMLIAHGWQLSHFLGEISRYRRGWIRWDPAVAGLRVSGTYPLADTEQILKTLTNALPLEIRYLTRSLVMVSLKG